MSAVPTYCPCGKALHTVHCLAELFGCKPRAARRMARQKRWPSTRVPVGAAGAGEYRFTNEMVHQIVSDGEQWPEKAANEPAPQRAKAAKAPQPTPRRTRQPPPAPALGSNVRPLVAKGPKRLGRSA